MKNPIGNRNAAQPYERKLDEWPQWNWGTDSLKSFIIFVIKLEGYQALLYGTITQENENRKLY
ncbi:hypothetical protein [Flexithrix dorotheae]|uniref:hypothetical protein n=1 Tax=Flexithrix dorotheae TaxID=70993 RepID=UPI0009FEE9E4|nr:hypothetical protein [Flexithrix dorotheae]